jgi:glc operon protein GlcG
MAIACCVVVVDDAGHLTAMVRMDGCSPLNVKVAIDKAFTAAGLGMSTSDWYDFIQTEPALEAGAAAGIERMIIFGGGLPIRWGDQVIGGLGVAGGRPSQDVEIGQAGLAALASHD